jgi:hypothetical protein
MARQDLDRHLPAQLGVLGAIHFAHATRANGREDFVRAEFVAWRKGHMLQLSLLDQGVGKEWITAHPEVGLQFA